MAHWGAIDGKNEWQDYDAVALYGLPYLDRIQPEASLIAIKQWGGGKVTDTAEYQRDIDRLYWGHIAVKVVQAINRVRCRRIIDRQGNCSVTDVYLLLPPKAQAANITKQIAKAMPHIKGRMWHSPVAKKKLRRSSYEEPLLSYLRILGRGEHLAKDVRNHLTIPQRAFEKLITKIKGETSILYHDLANLGCRYISQGAGRGARSYFGIN